MKGEDVRHPNSIALEVKKCREINMSSKLTLTIKDFPARRASITFPITSAQIRQQIVGSTLLPKLIVTRKFDSYSLHFIKLAFMQKAKPNHSNNNLSQLTLTFNRSDDRGKFLSTTIIDYFDAVVDEVERNQNEEKITFLADRKSGDFTISNIEVRLD